MPSVERWETFINKVAHLSGTVLIAVQCRAVGKLTSRDCACCKSLTRISYDSLNKLNAKFWTRRLFGLSPSYVQKNSTYPD